jgi:protein-S-isoprenylcysteine O-methyltransferase Ste14
MSETRKIRRWLRGRPSTTESTAALWAKSLVGALLFFGAFVVALPWVAHSLSPTILPVPRGIRIWGGGALFALGVSGWLICLDAFSRQGRGTPAPTDAPSRLVTRGLFSFLRNPIIASELMVLWGVALYVASAGILLYAVAATVGAHFIVIRVEEPTLRKRFGESYATYCRKVPRWFPRLRPWRSPGE